MIIRAIGTMGRSWGISPLGTHNIGGRNPQPESRGDVKPGTMEVNRKKLWTGPKSQIHRYKATVHLNIKITREGKLQPFRAVCTIGSEIPILS